MARNFAGGTDRATFANYGSGLLKGTTAFWMRTTQVTADVGLASMWNSSSRNGVSFRINSLANKITMEAYPGNPPTGIAMSSAVSVNDGNWHHIVGNWDGNLGAANSLYVDGVLENSGNSTRAWANGSANARILGHFTDAFWASYSGDLAEFAEWQGVHLNADEIAALAKGFSPKLIRPAACSFYAPLVREPGQRMLDDPTGAFTGTTEAVHPRMVGGLT